MVQNVYVINTCQDNSLYQSCSKDFDDKWFETYTTKYSKNIVRTSDNT